MDQNQLPLPLLKRVEQDYRHCLESLCRSTDAADASAVRKLPPCLVALSGGADSVFLLSALSQIYKAAGQAENLHVCHVNHGIRDAAKDDASFCAALTSALGHSYVEQTLTDCGTDEATLRERRYQALLHVASEQAIPYIVTAHHLDDQVETFLFRLARGTAPRGAVGIRPCKAYLGTTLLRPLLSWRHDFIVATLRDLGIASVQDDSNSDTKYSRNFLRHEILPRLTERFPATVANIEHFRELVALDQSYLEEQAAAQLVELTDGSGALRLDDFALLHGALQGRVLLAWLQQWRIEADQSLLARLQRMIQDGLGPQSVKQDRQVIMQHGRLSVEPAPSVQIVERLLAQAKPVSVAVPAATGRVIVPWLGCALLLTRLNEQSTGEQYEASRNTFTAYLQIGSLSSFELRLRAEGDLFAAPGGDGHKSRLKKYLHRLGSARAQPLADLTRLYQGGLVGALDLTQLLRYLPLVATGKEVLWLPGLGISETVRVQSSADLRLELMALGQHPDIDGACPGLTC